MAAKNGLDWGNCRHSGGITFPPTEAYRYPQEFGTGPGTRPICDRGQTMAIMSILVYFRSFGIGY